MPDVPRHGDVFGLHQGVAAQVADGQQAAGHAAALATANALDPVYAESFVQNGQYWHLITLSGCVGGCLLPIGNTAGYALMKSEDVTIWWYLKHITLKVLLGWFVSLGIYFLVDYFLR